LAFYLKEMVMAHQKTSPYMGQSYAGFMCYLPMKEEKFNLEFYDLKLELPVLRYYIESIIELKKPMQILEQVVQM